MKIVFENGVEFDIAERKVKRGLIDASRQWKNFDLYGAVEDAKAAFVEDAIYRKEWESVAVDDEGNESTQVYTEDMSEWCVPDIIVDHRDGTVTVYMGKKTELELLEEENAALLYQLLTGEEL